MSLAALDFVLNALRPSQNTLMWLTAGLSLPRIIRSLVDLPAYAAVAFWRARIAWTLGKRDYGSLRIRSGGWLK